MQWLSNAHPLSEDPAVLRTPIPIPEDLRSEFGYLINTHIGNALFVAHDHSAHARMWDGGVALARFCNWWYESCSLADTVVLELGAGTGVLGLTLGSFGARVTMTDIDSKLVRLMDYNISQNALDGTMRACRLDWNDSSTYLSQVKFDLIVAADVLFYGDGDRVLANALDSHVLPGRTEVLFCFNNVSPTGGLQFFSALSSRGYKIERLENREGMPVGGGVDDLHATFHDSLFVKLPDGRFLEAMKKGSESRGCIQIFRLTKPHAIWAVASRLESEGLLVRSSAELSSPVLGRLSVASTIKELELNGNRMYYSKISGDGPGTGWVSISAKGVPLLQVPTDFPGPNGFECDPRGDHGHGVSKSAGDASVAQDVSALDQANQAHRADQAHQKDQADQADQADDEARPGKIRRTHFVQVADTSSKGVKFARVSSPNGFGLRTVHQTFMCASDDLKSIIQVDAFRGAWEEFVEVPCLGGIGLKTAHGTFVSARDDGRIVQVSGIVGAQEKLLKVQLSNGFFALRTSFGGFVCARKLCVK